jgi:hypothetical protein
VAIRQLGGVKEIGSPEKGTLFLFMQRHLIEKEIPKGKQYYLIYKTSKEYHQGRIWI